jgi:hypothetical protein
VPIWAGVCCDGFAACGVPAGRLAMCLLPLRVGFLSKCLLAGVPAGVWLERGENALDPNQECPPRFRRFEERHCYDDDRD